MTTFSSGIGRNLALNTQGTLIDNLDGTQHKPAGYRPEFAYLNIGALFTSDEEVTVTVSFDLVMTVNTANPILQVYNTNYNGPMQIAYRNALQGETHAVGETIEKRCAVTSAWTPRSDPSRAGNFIEFYSIYGSGNVYSISNLMVELGDVAHPWRPAPEDTEQPSDLVYASEGVDLGDTSGLDTRLTTAEASITEQAGQIASKVAQSDFNTLSGRVDTAESTITQQANSITSLVEGLEQSSYFQQTEDGFTFTVDSAISTVAQAANNAQDSADSAATAAAAAAQAAEDASRVARDYLTFQNGELTIGTSESDIRSVLTNVKFAFKTDAGDIAYFGLNDDGIWQMHIATAFVDDMLRFGDYAWIKRDNGNMSIKWLGE